MSRTAKRLRALLTGVTFNNMWEVQAAFKAAYKREISDSSVYRIMSESRTNTNKFEGIFPYMPRESGQRFTFKPETQAIPNLEVPVLKTGLYADLEHLQSREKGLDNQLAIMAANVSNPIVAAQLNAARTLRAAADTILRNLAAII